MYTSQYTLVLYGKIYVHLSKAVFLYLYNIQAKHYQHNGVYVAYLVQPTCYTKYVQVHAMYTYTVIRLKKKRANIVIYLHVVR